MKTKIYKIILYVHIVLVIAVPLGCNKDNNEVQEPKETAKCSLITLEKQTAFPIDKIFVNGIPDDLKTNITVEFWYNNAFTEISMYVETDENNRSFIIAPIHPKLPLKGGELHVVFKDATGTIICDPKLLTISELPKAEEYTGQVASALENLLKQRTDFLNIDEAALSGDLANIEPTTVPFAMLYNLLHNEDAEFALIPFLNNDKVLTNDSFDKATSIDISNRILNKYGVLDYINQNIKDFKTEFSKSKSGKNNKETILGECDGIDIEDIADQMKAADNRRYSDPNTITGRYFQDLANVAMVAGLIPPLATGATIAGAVIFTIQKIEEANSKMSISHFTKIQFHVSNTDFLEETACPEPVRSVKVYAANDDWSIDKTIWEILLQLSAFVPTPNIKSIDEKIDFGIVSTFTTTQLTNLANAGYWNNGRLKIDAIECGPIDILNAKYLKGKTNEKAFKVRKITENDTLNTLEIYPIGTGIDGLEVSMDPNYFSGQTISESIDLNLTPIELIWETPKVHFFKVTPGETVYLDSSLKNSLSKFKDNINAYYTTKLGNIEEITPYSNSSDESGYYEHYKLVTPQKEKDYPMTVTVKYISDTICFRGTEYAKDIFDELLIEIDIKDVTILGDSLTCFQFGDIRDFDIDFSENIAAKDKKVIWSAKNEEGQDVDITQEGSFTAPNMAGIYKITATLESNPKIFGTTKIEVLESCGDFPCYWNFKGELFDMAYKQASYASYIYKEETLAINLENEYNLIGVDDQNRESMTVYLHNSFLPEEGKTKVTTGTIEGKTNKDYFLNILGLNLQPDSPQYSRNASQLIGDYSVSLTLTNGFLEGKITGTLQTTQPDFDEFLNDPKIIYFPFTLNFGGFDKVKSCNNQSY